MGLLQPDDRHRRRDGEVALKLKGIWADSERALNELLAGCRPWLSAQNIADIEEFIAVNEHECAYHVLSCTLEDGGHSVPGELQPLIERLERRFYGKEK
jgi:hypothetical protein